MTWIEWAQTLSLLLGGLGLLGGGGVVAVHRLRNGKGKRSDPPPKAGPQHVIHTYPAAEPPEFDAAGETGRFAAALQNAPTDVLLQVAGDIRAIACQRPATRADLEAVAKGINTKLEVHSRAIGDLRTQLAGLPCRDPAPTECEEVRR